MLINDLDNPMAKVYKGDKFGYNYDINSIIATAWLQNMINRNHWDFNYGLKVSARRKDAQWTRAEELSRQGQNPHV